MRVCASVRSRVVAPTSAMNIGINGSVTATMTPEIQSAASSATTTTSGTIAASRSWGRYSE